MGRLNKDFLTGRNIPTINDNAISNVVVDIDFLEGEFKRIDRPHLTSAFKELRTVCLCTLVLLDSISNQLTAIANVYCVKRDRF